ncbi:DUF1048 domain-containing protein [Nonomuraea sp. NPDC049784]|uniref:DUF1048 domain-containing protein n=1 Tax=Nonomuraea sp. NPDC049784 TaxID=3154361 RepID=UPI0034092E49
MTSGWIEKVTGSLEDKKRYRQYKERIRQLPATYRTAVEALERYLMQFGWGDGTGWLSMYEDLLYLFEQSAADKTPIREIVGEDPVEFIEDFVRSYPAGQWRLRERQRLINAIERAAGEEEGAV